MRILDFKELPDKNGYFVTIRRWFRKDETYFCTTDWKIYDEDGNYMDVGHQGPYLDICYYINDYHRELARKQEAERMKKYIQDQKAKIK